MAAQETHLHDVHGLYTVSYKISKAKKRRVATHVWEIDKRITNAKKTQSIKCICR